MAQLIKKYKWFAEIIIVYGKKDKFPSVG